MIYVSSSSDYVKVEKDLIDLIELNKYSDNQEYYKEQLESLKKNYGHLAPNAK